MGIPTKEERGLATLAPTLPTGHIATKERLPLCFVNVIATDFNPNTEYQYIILPSIRDIPPISIGQSVLFPTPNALPEPKVKAAAEEFRVWLAPPIAELFSYHILK